MINATRERQRDERTPLRVKVAELEDELHVLKYKQASAPAATPVADPEAQSAARVPVHRISNRAPLTHTDTLDLHERVAHSAKDAKYRAQVANAHMRAVLETQRKVTASIAKLLMKPLPRVRRVEQRIVGRCD